MDRRMLTDDEFRLLNNWEMINNRTMGQMMIAGVKALDPKK